MSASTDVSSVVSPFFLLPSPTRLSHFLLSLFFKTWVGGLKILQEQFVTKIFGGGVIKPQQTFILMSMFP